MINHMVLSTFHLQPLIEPDWLWTCVENMFQLSRFQARDIDDLKTTRFCMTDL